MEVENIAYNSICITLDVDWAADAIIERVIEIMQRTSVKATLFATHQSQLLRNLTSHQFEVGLHPNFDEANGNFRRPIERLKTLYPNAKGGRSHSLFVSSNILKLYMENGLKYESNIFLPGHENLHPVFRFKDFLSIPFCWSDDKHLSMKNSFTLRELPLRMRGLKVFNFHPIHVFMNTSSERHYKSFKSYQNDIDRIKKLMNSEGEGIGTLFQSLLYYIRENQKPTYTLYEIYEEYVHRT